MTTKRPQIQLNAESERRNRKLAEAVEQIARNTLGVPKYVPGEDNGSYIKIAEAPKRGEPVGEREPPVPPAHLYLCFEGSQDVYLDTGRADVEVMRSLLAECGFEFPRGSRVLDFGCGARTHDALVLRCSGPLRGLGRRHPRDTHQLVPGESSSSIPFRHLHDSSASSVRGSIVRSRVRCIGIRQYGRASRCVAARAPARAGTRRKTLRHHPRPSLA
jgi:hypothetical protein